MFERKRLDVRVAQQQQQEFLGTGYIYIDSKIPWYISDYVGKSKGKLGNTAK